MKHDSLSGQLIFRSVIDFSGAESIGDREGQEDYSLFRTISSGRELLAVLADGMGGHACGDVASKKAVEAFDETFNSYPSGLVPTKLGAAIQQANNELARSVEVAPALDGMGCTLVGLHVGQEGLQWISVGDSPLFLFRDRRVSRLNDDHSMGPVIDKALRSGKISRDEAANHPHRHSLRSALMGEKMEMIDAPCTPFPLYRGDVLILASDGLLTLSEEEIAKQVKKYAGATADVMAKMLVAAVEAKKRPRQDNTTVQVVIVPGTLGAKQTNGRWIWSIGGLVLAILVIALGYTKWDWQFSIPKWPFHPNFSIFKSAPVKEAPAPSPVPVPVAPANLPAQESQSSQPAPSPSAAPDSDHKSDSRKSDRASVANKNERSKATNPAAGLKGNVADAGKGLAGEADKPKVSKKTTRDAVNQSGSKDSAKASATKPPVVVGSPEKAPPSQVDEVKSGNTPISKGGEERPADPNSKVQDK